MAWPHAINAVPVVMAKGVVHRLEPVKVEEQKLTPPRPSSPAGEARLRCAGDAEAVQQPGELVAPQVILEFVERVDEVADVLDRQ